MAIVNTISENNLINAMVNNTFYEDKFEDAIKSAMYNSFNYLDEIQEAFINIYRFNLTEDDLFVDRDGAICFSIPKDFIDQGKRKRYKHSIFFSKWLSITDIIDNQSIFSWFPVVLIDGETVFSYSVKASLDGTTTIRLDYVKYKRLFMDDPHSIQVFYLMDTNYTKFETTLSEIQSNDWILPTSVTGFDYQDETLAFMYLRDKDFDNGSNIFLVDIGEDGEVILDSTNDSLYQILVDAYKVEITILAAENLHKIEENLVIHKRYDNDRQSAICVLQPEEGKTYPMCIPYQNLILLKVNKTTGETVFENNKDVRIHYPNIYEIMSDDVDDIENYEYKAAYFYNKAEIAFSYINNMFHIHNFYKRKLHVDTLKEAIEALLYDTYEEEDMLAIQNFFIWKFESMQPYYEYDMKSYGESDKYKHDFDYKVDKFKEFGSYDYHILEDYGKSVTNPFYAYILYTKNIDLVSRMRIDTYSETSDPYKQKRFDEEMYLFMFEERNYDEMSLRFFINGFLCTDYYTIHQGKWTYIYIPTRLITNNDCIYIEKFYPYYKVEKVKFTNITDFITIDFEDDSLVQPTLYDLFITDMNSNIIDRNNFKMYALIGKRTCDVSDDVTDSPGDEIAIVFQDDHHSTWEDPETGELYVDMSEFFDDDIHITLIDPISTDGIDPYSRAAVRYLSLRKIKIRAKDSDVLHQNFYIVVNKIPTYNKRYFERSSAVPTVTIYKGGGAWKEDKHYVRCFYNGKYIGNNCNLYSDPSTHIAYITPNIYAGKKSTVMVDVSPFSYDVMYTMDTIPLNGVIDLTNKLSRPFNLHYYEVYLNGRRIVNPNIQVLSPYKIKLLNVHSIHNLVIQQKDRDEEYLTTVAPYNTVIDDFLDDIVIYDEDKEDLIDAIIRYEHGDDFDYHRGDIVDTEEDITEYYYSSEAAQKVLFYTNVILPQGVARPNTLILDEEDVIANFEAVYNLYANPELGRIVIRPNILYDAELVAMIGKYTEFIDDDREEWSEEAREELNFYRNVIRASSILRPNVYHLSEDELDANYPAVKSAYGTDDSLILHPNRDYNTDEIAMVGQNEDLAV